MKRLLKEYWVLIIVVMFFILARILTIHHHEIVFWDASVYVGMGKYLFSHGTVGTWEVLRPLGLPILLGVAWKLGLDPYLAGTILSLLVSAALLVLVYFFGEEIKKNTGNCAVLILATTGIFFKYSAIPVTDIISTFISLLALFLVYKATTTKQYFFGGLVVALAFNFRFPQGLLVVVGGLVIILKMFFGKNSAATKALARQSWNVRIGEMVENLFAFAGGFFTIVVPTLIVNQYFYGNAFLPYIEATASIKGYPSLYNKGLYFYFVQLFQQDPLFIFALVPIGLVWKKKYRTVAMSVITIATIIVMGYFVYQVHKELRFALAFLPYIALLSGVGIVYVLEWCNVPELLFFGIFAITAFMVHASALVHMPQNQDTQTLYAFNTYLNNEPKVRVLASAPYLLAYSDVLITHNLYADWNDAYTKYNAFRSSNDYVTLDSCSLDLGCPDNNHCQDDKQVLLTELNKQDREVFTTTTPSQCVLSIYKINH